MQSSSSLSLPMKSDAIETKTLNRIVTWSLMTAGSVLFSFAFACALPFAALASFAALRLTKRDAFLAVGSVWALNQAIGFGCLNYPHTASCLAWGVAMGVAAFASFGIADWVAHRTQTLNKLVVASLTLLAAFVTFKALILIVGKGINGTVEFTWSNLVEMLAINVCTFAAVVTIQLLAASLLLRISSLFGADELRASRRAAN